MNVDETENLEEESENTEDTAASPAPIVDGEDEGDLLVASHEGLLIEKNDRSLSEFYRWQQSGRLVVDPEWQRQYVWDRKRAAKLVESFLRDIPVPVIYLGRNEEGKYEVIDGLQRLTSVFDFFDNKYPLRGLELVPKYNGRYFKELDEKDQHKLQDATLRTFELASRTPKDLMFVIFERLNTGGIRLNDMEIRNCLFRGRLNELIKKLAQDADFLSCVNQRNLATRMSDRTLVLRFLAFYERTYQKAKQGLKAFINEFFTTYRNPNDDKLKEYEKQFRKAMRASLTVFGDNGFRLRRDTAKGGGEWAPRVNAAIFQCVATSFCDYDLGQLTRRADAIFEEYVDLVSTDEEWVDAVRVSTGDPSRIEYVFSTWGERLKSAIGTEPPNDAARAFTRTLKEEMFKTDNQCKICGQKVSLLLDAALDHDLHYWRGGNTVPENARVVHRLCNLKRSK